MSENRQKKMQQHPIEVTSESAVNYRVAVNREDLKINVKIKTSLLWVALMFLYLYNDVFSFYRKDTVNDIISGVLGGMQVNQGFLLASAIIMAIPILMIVLSIALPAKMNRWTNLIVGIAYGGILLATQLVPSEKWTYWALYEVLEAAFIILIVWNTWKWPHEQVYTQTDSKVKIDGN